MTEAETMQILAGVRLLWPHSNLGAPAQAVTAWHGLLGRFTAADVEAAVRELAATGREHAPPPGVVLQKCADRATDLPEWDEAWQEVQRLVRRVGRYAAEDGTLGPPPARAFTHPLIAAWAVPAWRELCDGPAPGASAYGTFHAQQRESYRAARGRLERGVALEAVGAARRRGLPRAFAAVLTESAGLPALTTAEPSDQEADAA